MHLRSGRQIVRRGRLRPWFPLDGLPVEVQEMICFAETDDIFGRRNSMGSVEY